MIIHRELAKCPPSLTEPLHQLNFRNQHSAVIYKHCWYMKKVLLLFKKVTNIAQSLVPAGFTENWETPGLCFCLMVCRTQISKEMYFKIRNPAGW